MEYDFVFGDEHEQPELDPAQPEQPEHNQTPLKQAELPVSAHKQVIMDLIDANQISIICGTTGSGKTTQLPKYLSKYGFVACTQPRRLAAMSVAQRVADELETPLGQRVGYSIRFDDCSTKDTEIKFMTDGILMREFLGDRDLSNYSAIMIDEAHERTLHTDIILVLLKEVCQRRPELRVVISSATLDAQKFKTYFNAPVFTVPGRTHPVKIWYTRQPEQNYLQAALSTVLKIHTSDKMGDVLVFLPGQDEIETLAEILTDARNKLGASIKELVICPVFANMPPHQQKRIFADVGSTSRKVILATNIAETSLTIEGITHVIDPGLVKRKQFSPKSGMDSLNVYECSQASAQQRAGRAGRTRPGECFRLYPRECFDKLPVESLPEVLRTNLASVCLLLMSLGVRNVLEFDFVDKPSRAALVQALEQLYGLGGVNGECQLTKTGRRMVELPVDPMMAKTILEAHKLGCMDVVVLIIALLGEQSIFYRPKNKKTEADEAHKMLAAEGGDHMTLLNAFRRWKELDYSPKWCSDNFIQYKSLLRARNVQRQLLRVCQRVLAPSSQSRDGLAEISGAFAGGFVGNVAQLSRSGEFYTTLTSKIPVFVHPSSSLFGVAEPPKYVLFNEIVVTSKEYMRGVLAVDEKVLAARGVLGVAASAR